MSEIVQGSVFRKGTGEMLFTLEASPAVLAAQVSAEHGVVAGAWDARTHYVSGGAPTERPGLGIAGAASKAVGVPWAPPGVPPGTVVVVDGASVGSVDGSGLSLRFDFAETYQVELRPPWPWRPASIIVTVTP